MSCGFSLFLHFQTTFPSVVVDFKLFSQNIPNKMISKKKISTLKNLEVPICYSKHFKLRVLVKFNLFPEQFI